MSSLPPTDCIQWVAAARASGPGSFQAAFLDALATVDGDAVRSRAELT